MKTITFNPTANPSVYVSCKNLGQMIAFVESEGNKEDLYIAKIHLNGKVLDEDEENLLSTMAVAEVKDLRVELMSMTNLVSMTMMSVIQLLQDLQLKSVRLAEIMGAKNTFPENSIKEIFVQSKVLIDSLEEIFALHINHKFTLRHFSLWREAEKELSNILQLVLQAYHAKNGIIVSELLGIAFPDALQQWEEVLEKEVLDSPALSKIFNLNIPREKGDNGVDA